MLNQNLKVFNLCLSPSEGGLEFCVVKFAKKLKEEGCDSIVVCLPDSLIYKKSKAANLKTLTIKSGSFLPAFIHTAFMIRKYKPNLIITHRSPGLKRSALHKIFFPHLRIISVLHTLFKSSKKDWLHRFFYSKVDEFVVFTKIQKLNACEYLPIDKSNVKIIPHTVDTKIFRPSQNKKQIKKSIVPLIGCVGRFDLKKGQIELIKAAKKLKDKGLHFNLAFVGQDTKNEEGIRKKCENFVKEFQLEDCIQFFDHKADIFEYYRTFDVFVMPSFEETFGLVLIEAMASGCLCISTQAGGPIEILDEGKAGILVVPKSPESLELALEDVLKNPFAYNQIKINGLKRVQEKYSDSSFGTDLSLILKTVKYSELESA